MRERDVTYVPTLAVVEVMAKLAATRERPRGFPAELWETLRARAELITRDPLQAAMANVRTAATAGVRVATGTDAQGPRMGFGTSLHRELELLVASGLTPREALTAATSAAGAALRVDGLGRLGVGAPADIVLAAAEPWADIRKLRDIRAVIRAGRIASGQPRSGRRRR
jgi:imidazolonepropionase-like amidohydrolase